MLYVMTCVYIWASLSDSHASMTDYVVHVYACLLVCLLACLLGPITNFPN